MKTYSVEYKWLNPKSPWIEHSTYRKFETKEKAKQALNNFPDNPDVKFRIVKK